MSNKITLEAIITTKSLANKHLKELASTINLPENSQQDLLFLSAILVSTGTNKNGATFLGSELIQARDTICQKALDVEHDDQKIIGHIVKAMYLDFEGNIIDDNELYSKLISIENSNEKQLLIKDLDGREMDIGIICIVYKDRFPEISSEIEKGEWKVSMECYYKDFDLKVGNIIIPRANCSKNFAKLDKKVKEDVKLVVANKAYSSGMVSRVLRGIKFCGVGIVKKPANDRSLILEAAAESSRQAMLREKLVEAASFSLDNNDHIIEATVPSYTEIVQVESGGYYLLTETDTGLSLVNDSYKTSYKEASIDAIKLSSTQGKKYFVVTGNSLLMPRDLVELNETSEANTFKTDLNGEIAEINSYTGDINIEKAERLLYGPTDRSTDLCISFEKYLHEFPGRPNPGRILATHWCKLFNKPCPVLGADAHDTSCLRNKYSHLVVDSTVFTDALIPSTFNPVINTKLTTPISNMDLPITKSDEEVILDKPIESESQNKSSNIIEEQKPVEDIGINTFTQERNQDDPYYDPQADKEDMNNFIKEKPTIISKDPYSDFSIKVINLPKLSRASLKDEEFAYTKERILPIDNQESTKLAVTIFPKLTLNTMSKETKELAMLRVYINAIKYNIDLTGSEFEKLVLASLQSSEEEWAIPRLKLLPLNSKEQVIAAIGKAISIKVDLTDREKDIMIASILRAAKKFNIDTSSFRDKLVNIR